MINLVKIMSSSTYLLLHIHIAFISYSYASFSDKIHFRDISNPKILENVEDHIIRPSTKQRDDEKGYVYKPWNDSNNNGSRHPDETNLSDTSNSSTSARNNWKRQLLPEESCGKVLPRRILGGVEVDIDEYPWLSLLQYRDRSGKMVHVCGGTLISSRYVLTAAHCTIGVGISTTKLKLENVRLGEWDLTTETDCQQDTCNENVQDIRIEQVINHPGYGPRKPSQDNDIALLRLEREAEINQFVQPICLPLDIPDLNNLNNGGKRMSVAGWGRTSNAKNSESHVKKKVNVMLTAWEYCRNFYESYANVKIQKTQLCAGGEEGKDSCQGDSGGPLMSIESRGLDFRWFIFGIVSSGPSACGVQGNPSLYTKVADFTDWILDNVKE